MRDRVEVRTALTGPVATVRTPFLKNGDIDHAGLARSVDWMIEHGSRAVILTYGDSLFSVLSDAEVGEVTRTVVKRAAGRALVIAADRQWATRQTVAFAGEARGIGADMIMVLPPNWGGSVTAETLVAHYAAVAAQLPVMVVTNLFMGAREPLGLRVLELAVERVDGIWALKEDVAGNFQREACRRVAGRWAVIAAREECFIDVRELGAVGYMTPFYFFLPQVVRDTWAAMQQGRWEDVRRFITEYDQPYRAFVNALPGGYHAGLMGAFELRGIAGRWRRAPYHSLSDAELAALREFFRGRGWL
jgi:dihydrodipicolinate synthase/N-acetylneuraminate lyase